MIDPNSNQRYAQGEMLAREWLSEEGVDPVAIEYIGSLGIFIGMQVMGAVFQMDKDTFSRSITCGLITAYQLGRAQMREELLDGREQGA